MKKTDITGHTSGAPYVNVNGRLKLNPKLKLKVSANQTGVYMIYKNKRLKYIGFSAWNLYKVFTRHFQKWSEAAPKNPYQKQHYHFLIDRREAGINVKIIFTKKNAAKELEELLISKYTPKGNVMVPKTKGEQNEDKAPF